MPTINLQRRKPRDKTYNKKQFQDIYQDKRWKRLRAWKIRENPLCEECLKEDRTRQTEEVHHIIPIDLNASKERQEALAFNPDNLQSLCIECHHKKHQG